MRLIKVYGKWTSPGALVAHVLSKEDITVVHYGEIQSGVVSDAVAKAKKLIWVATIQKVNNLLWVGALLAGVAWPLVKIPADIKTFFTVLFGIAFLVSIYGFIKIYIARHKFGKFDFSALKHAQGPALAPPVIALRQSKVSVPSIRRSAMFFVLAVLLNCAIFASPAYPAKVDGEYLVENSFVAPWASWESTEKIQQGSMIAIVAAPEVDQIHVARAAYTVHRVGFAESEIEWQEWMRNRFSHLVSRLTESLLQSAPPDLTTDDAIPWLLEAWEEEFEEGTALELLRTAMIANFQDRYDGTFELLKFDIEITHISLKDYRKEMSK